MIFLNTALAASPRYRQTVEPPAELFLFEEFPNPMFGYSFRQLSPTAIKCIRVSNGTTEQDFGFVNRYLDTASLLSFCNGVDGRVVRFYDQSGNGIDWISEQRPYVVSTGVLEEEAGKVLIRSKVWDQLMVNTIPTPPALSTDFCVIQNDSSTRFTLGRDISPSAYWFSARSGNTSTTLDNSVGTPSYFADGSEITPLTLGELYARTSGGIHLATTINLALFDDFNIYSAYKNSGLPSVNWLERIVYPSTIDRSLIDENIKSYYGITL